MAKRGGKVTKITATVTDKSRPDYGETYEVKVTQGRRGDIKQEYIKEGRVVQTREVSGGVQTVTSGSGVSSVSAQDQQIVEAGMRAGQSQDTIFKTETGQGFSADPREIQRLRNEADARRQSIAPQILQNRETERKVFNTAYDRPIPSGARSGDIRPIPSQFDAFISGAQETYEDINKQFSSGIVRPIADTIGRFPRYGGGGNVPLVKTPYVEEIGGYTKRYVTERPLDVASNVYLGYGVGRLSKIPVVAGFVSRPSVKTISYGAFAISGGGRVISGEPVTKVLSEEAVNLGAFSFGLKGGLSTKGYPFERIYPKTEPKVERLEATRYTSESVDFDGNIITPKGSLQSGRFTTRTAGLYKVGKNYYALKAEEFGETLKQSDILTELISSGKIKIQRFNYIPEGLTIKTERQFTKILKTPESFGINKKNIGDVKIVYRPFFKENIKSIFSGNVLYGKYNLRENKIYVNIFTPKTERVRTVIHELGHSYFFDTGTTFRFRDLSFKGRRSPYFKQIGNQILDDFYKINPKLAGKELREASSYPKGELLEEFAVRFAERNPSELIKPTTITGRELKSIYKEGSVFYNAPSIKLKPKTNIEININEIKFPRGRPRSASIASRGLSLEEEGVTKVTAYSQISSRNNRFSRITNANIKINDKDYTIRGLSVDVKGGKRIAGSLNVIAGRGSTILQYSGVTPYGEPYTFTKTSGFNIGVSKSVIPKVSVFRNIKSYRREQFINTGRSVTGLKSGSALAPVGQLSNTQAETLLKQAYKADVAKVYNLQVSSVKLAPAGYSLESPKVSQTQRTYRPITSLRPVKDAVYKPLIIARTREDTVTRQLFKTSSKVKNVIDTRFRQAPQSVNDTLLRQYSGTRQRQVLRQGSLSKQATRTTTRLLPPPVFPRIGVPRIPSLTIGFFGGSGKKSKGFSFMPKRSTYDIYAIPDLLSVSQTEQRLYSRYGKGEAIVPKLTPSVRIGVLKSFSGYGRIPTGQQQIWRKI